MKENQLTFDELWNDDDNETKTINTNEITQQSIKSKTSAQLASDLSFFYYICRRAFDITYKENELYI